MYVSGVLENKSSQLIKSYTALPLITIITFCYVMILKLERKLEPPKNGNTYVAVTLIYSHAMFHILTFSWPAGLTNSLFKSTGITVSLFFSMLPSTLKYLYSVEPVRMHFSWNSSVQMILCAMLHSSIAHNIICTLLFHGKMHYDWFNGIEILQGRWQHGENVGYC